MLYQEHGPRRKCSDKNVIDCGLSRAALYMKEQKAALDSGAEAGMCGRSGEALSAWGAVNT